MFMFNPTCNNKTKKGRRRRRRRNPTMEKSRKVESEDHAKNLALRREFNDLQRSWASIKISRVRRPRTPSHSRTTTITSSHLIQTSPRTLMSSLQCRKPRLLRNKNYNNAVEEILMDRRAAISSGRFKGRQLFVATEESYSGGQRCSDWMNGVPLIMNYNGGKEKRGDQRHELPFPEEEKTVVEVGNAAEKRGGDGRRKEKGGGCLLATACLAIVLFVIALAFFSMSCNGYFVEESILVPT